VNPGNLSQIGPNIRPNGHSGRDDLLRSVADRPDRHYRHVGDALRRPLQFTTLGDGSIALPLRDTGDALVTRVR
jgi:hypothetical protein